MTTHIKLDTNALSALFPEGSEARVKLQDCVIANMADTLLNKQHDRIISQVASKLEAHSKSLQNETNSMIANYDWGRAYSLKEETVKLITEQVNYLTQESVKDLVKETVELDKTFVEDLVKTRTKWHYDNLVNKAFRDKVGALQKAIEEKLSVFLE